MSKNIEVKSPEITESTPLVEETRIRHRIFHRMLGNGRISVTYLVGKCWHTYIYNNRARKGQDDMAW